MNGLKSPNVKRHAALVGQSERTVTLGQKGVVLWLTGLSGSGKSTIAMALEKHLLMQGIWVTTLDGDNIRHGLCGDLGFSPQARSENLRRVGHVAKLFYDAGLVTICSFVSPRLADRRNIRQIFPMDDFLLAHVSTPLATCESRDPKGLYRRARSGEIKDMTGISAPYEKPQDPEFNFDAGTQPLETIVQELAGVLIRRVQPTPNREK